MASTDNIRVMHKVGLSLTLAVLLSACAGGSHGAAVPPQPGSTLPTAAVPPMPNAAVPARPEFLRTTPAPPPLANGTRTPSTTGHPPFFNGEIPLSNGVYYLQLAGSGNLFGFYSYLSDPRYIYHFDLLYEFVVDAANAANGVYLYDFASGHWWYTAPQFPFPYIYDFSLNTYLYYFPDTNRVGHYTTNPRYFSNLSTGQIITLPGPLTNPASFSFLATGQANAQTLTVSEPNYSGAFTVDSSSCAGVATVGTPQNNVYTVTPVAAGTCNAIITDPNNGRSAVQIQVTTTGIVGQ
jgi:hypothetical protein